jgi:uncharacterized protein involved in exopolysaccharide biosynthesis
MDTRTQAVINELKFQRNEYANACAELSAEIAVRNERIKELEAKLLELAPDG